MNIPAFKANDSSPASKAGIDLFEAQNRIILPLAYRKFLSISGGGYPVRDWSSFGETGDFVAHIYGLHSELLDHALRQFGAAVSRFFPIAVSNGGGYFLLSLAQPDSGAVFYWDHELEDFEPPTFNEIIRVSNSFDEWIDSLGEPTD